MVYVLLCVIFDRKLTFILRLFAHAHSPLVPIQPWPISLSQVIKHKLIIKKEIDRSTLYYIYVCGSRGSYAGAVMSTLTVYRYVVLRRE